MANAKGGGTRRLSMPGPSFFANSLGFDIEDEPLGALPGTLTTADERRAARELPRVGLWTVARKAYDKLTEGVEFRSARGHIPRTCAFTGVLAVLLGISYMVIRLQGLVYFEAAALLVTMYAIAGLAFASCGCLAVTMRLTKCLGCFASLSYVMAVLFGSFSVSMTSIAIAAFVANQRYGLSAIWLSGICLILAICFAILVWIWAAAAHDARLTRLNILLSDIPGSVELARRTKNTAWGNWALARPVYAGAQQAKYDGEDDEDGIEGAEDAQKNAPTIESMQAGLALGNVALQANAIVRLNTNNRSPSFSRDHTPIIKPVPTVDEMAGRQSSRQRTRVVCALVVLPLFIAGCLLLYPLVFANTAAVDVEVLIVGKMGVLGDAHVAWEGSMGEIFKNENTRPSVRTLALPEAKAEVARYRNVPMLPALARWRKAGVLTPLGRAPIQIVMFVIDREFTEPAPSPPPPPFPPPSPPTPPNATDPADLDGCMDDPDWGTAWCIANNNRCGRPIYNSRCLLTCGLCASRSPPPNPPPPRPPPRTYGTAIDGEDVENAGQNASQCIKSMLLADELLFGSTTRNNRLAATGLSDEKLVKIAKWRTRGAVPADSPRTVALSDFKVICFMGNVLQSHTFWDGARITLGDEAVDDPPCGVAAGVVGGMGPLAGAVYQQGLGAMVEAYRPNTNDTDVLEEAGKVCLEMYSNPQLAVDVRALLQTIGDSERMLTEQSVFLGRPDFSNFVGPSNAWHEISFRLLTSRWSKRRLIDMVNATVHYALPQPQYAVGKRIGFMATTTSLNGIEQREQLNERRANMYRLAWEDRNAELSREDSKHQYVELHPVRSLPNGDFLSDLEQKAIGLVKVNKIDEARKYFEELITAFAYSDQKGENAIKEVIEGCTEISVAITAREVSRFGIRALDSSRILALAQFGSIANEVEARVVAHKTWQG